jgi:hypothetical protein
MRDGHRATDGAPGSSGWRQAGRTRAWRLATAAASAAVALGCVATLSAAPAAGAATPGSSLPPGVHEYHGPGGTTDQNVCSDAIAAGQARCFARVRTDSAAANAKPSRGRHVGDSATLGNGGAYDPSYLQSAYNTPSATNGAGQTVAIVDAYDDPNAAADLSYYRSFFGLSACTTGNGCFTKVNQSGGTSYPAANSSWGQETSLDLDMVSAICPNCKILLVEAQSASLADLGTAVDEAVALGANVVSNSYGGSEYASEVSDNASYYDHPGVAVVVASGDSGYGAQFPAASPDVTAVGGTTLNQTSNTGTRQATETAWSGAGSGCSAYEPKPTWQTDTGCSNRTIADVSAVADPNTGVWVYDTYGNGGWSIFGGTSVATPIVGSLYALADNPSGGTTLPDAYPYSDPAGLNDVTSGSNGSCGGSYLCTAGVGYDGPTGLGTPNSTPAFSAGPTAPPPPPTVPGAPTNLSATPGNASVSLSWSAPASNGGANVTSYDVYRSTTAGGEGSTPLVSGITGTGYTDTTVTNGTTYYYEVAAVNSVGTGPVSNEAAATPAPPSATVPGAPVGLTARTDSSRGVDLSWSAPASNGGSAITGYAVYRSTRSGGETLYGTVSCTSATCSAVDTGTRHGTVYYYEVAATNSVGTGTRSNQASAKAR